MDATDNLVKSHTKEVESIIDTVNMNLNLITSRTPAAALNLPGAVNDIATGKSRVEGALSRFAQINNEIDNATKKVTALGKQSGTAYTTSKAQKESLKRETDKNKTLFELRKAQAESLKEKYESYNHTSWLGLWRPLADDTRFLLYILSLILVLIAGVTVYFLFKDNIITLPAMPTMPTMPTWVTGAVPAIKGGSRHFR